MNEVVLEKKFELEELLELRVLGEPLRAFGELVGLQLRIFDLQGKELFNSGGEIHFCELIHQADPEDRICQAVKEKLLSQPLVGSSAAQILSACGSRYTILPITHQFDALGRVVLGPYQDHEITDSRLSAISAQYRIELSRFVSAYQKLPAPSPEQVKKIARFTSRFLDAFIFISAKRLLTSLMHLELLMQSKDTIFKKIEMENQGTPEDRSEIEKYKKMF